MAHSRNLRIPIIQHLIPTISYTDVSLEKYLVLGIPISGVVPRTSPLPSNATDATVNLPDVKSSVRETNIEIARSICKSSDFRLKQKWWGLSNGEFRKGWPSQPTPITTNDSRSIILSPRFCIAEQHGLKEAKFRLIGEFSRSNVNKTVQMADTYCPQGIDSFVALTRIQSANGVSDLKQWPIDFPHAYKTIALHPSSSEAAHICFVNTPPSLLFLFYLYLIFSFERKGKGRNGKWKWKRRKKEERRKKKRKRNVPSLSFLEEKGKEEERGKGSSLSLPFLPFTYLSFIFLPFPFLFFSFLWEG